MIERIDVQNYRCFTRLSVDLAPLTVLVGKNDTGKTAFLSAVVSHVARGPFTSEDFLRFEDKEITITSSAPKIKQRGTRHEISWEMAKGAQWAPVNAQRLPQRKLELFHLPSTGIPMQSGGVNEGIPAPDLVGNGSNVPALLDHYLRVDRRRFDRVEQALRELVPGFEELAIATPSPAQRRVDLVIEGGLRIQGDRASTGVRLLIFFVTLAYHPTPPELILIEEPDMGVHPRRLADIMRLLREITEGKHGDREAQVILTTHSPYLLDLVDLERDQLLIFQRGEDGVRTAQPADKDRLRTFLDEFMLGEIWYNRGEEGLVRRA
jgi:predicted ATPase